MHDKERYMALEGENIQGLAACEFCLAIYFSHLQPSLYQQMLHYRVVTKVFERPLPDQRGMYHDFHCRGDIGEFYASLYSTGGGLCNTKSVDGIMTYRDGMTNPE